MARGLDVLQLKAIFEISESGWVFCMLPLLSLEDFGKCCLDVHSGECIDRTFVGNGDWL